MRAKRTKTKSCGTCKHLKANEKRNPVGKYQCVHPDAPPDDMPALDDCCDDWEAYATPKQERLTLPWEYCECGCKGWNLNVGGVYFHLHWDLKGKWYLSREHGISNTRKVYKSAPEAEAVVKTALAEALYDRNAERAEINLVLQESNDRG